jgi:hypothetical protein
MSMENSENIAEYSPEKKSNIVVEEVKDPISSLHKED